MNKHNAVKRTRQFDNNFSRFHNLSGSDSHLTAQNHTKVASQLNTHKINVFSEQMYYAFHDAIQNLLGKPLATFLTIMVIALSLTLPSVCYIVHKNINQAASQYYPSPQITVYLDKALDSNAAAHVLRKIQAEQGVKKVNYLSREEALNEFRNWSGFGDALDILEENPLPAMVEVIPNLVNSQGTYSLDILRDRLTRISGIDEVRMDDNWFTRLTSLTMLVERVSTTIGALMVTALFLVIGNSVRLSIFARRNTINVQKLIGATDGFILRQFLYDGTLLGFAGAFLSLILSKLLVIQITPMVTKVAQAFGINFNIIGLGCDECLLLLLICSMIGWVSAWLVTVQYLRHFTPD